MNVENVRSRTRAAEIARRIEDEVIADGWRVGAALGSETAFMERFEVGRSVVREAFRILESRHVAKPRRGPGGGLVVTAPERSAVLDQASLFLEYDGFAADDLFQMMEILEVSAVEQVSAIIDADGLTRMREILAAEVNVGDLRFEPVTVYTELARLSGNPVLSLFIHIGTNLARTHGVRPSEGELQWIHQHSVELVEALEAGDTLAAVRSVRRRLRGMSRRQSVSSHRIPSTSSTGES
ncbi:FadR/GntR family transcriptional regulator [Williamsia sp. DF01-3]|uniref:FadR/GntR family transcriptional regulator n=1 Tax=Williamsia sp. DF01-3 TaxID=2934157 RepID=UPI001FF351D2|nr:FCD domain-containing protein [Williamsia sp. DF01-3]MCK0516718.1 FCD domain-containing protein [Williamsia sp. DF01-3]